MFRKLGIAAGIATTVLMIIATGCSSTPKTSLTVQADAVEGATGIKDPSNICVETSHYYQGESVVFRVKVTDPLTGQPMDDKAVTNVAVKLKDGQTLTAKYGGHPGKQPVDYFWTTAWAIPKDYPTGSTNYTVEATAKDGRTGSYIPFNVSSSLLTVVAPKAQ